MLQAAEEGATAAAAAPSKAAEKRARKRAAARAAAAAAAAPTAPPAVLPAARLPDRAQPSSPAAHAAPGGGMTATLDTAAGLQHMSVASNTVQANSGHNSAAVQINALTAAAADFEQPHSLPQPPRPQRQPPAWMLCPITKVHGTIPEHVLLG